MRNKMSQLIIDDIKIICNLYRNELFNNDEEYYSFVDVDDKTMIHSFHNVKDHWWGNFSIFPNLSEEFMIEFQDKLDWRLIALSQKLSQDFLIKFHNKIELAVKQYSN